MKLLTLLILAPMVAGMACNEKKSPAPIQVKADSLMTAIDTVPSKVEAVFDFIDNRDSVLKELFIQYYKAGWMDGSDAVIDLSNVGNLTDKAVKKKKFKQWREMEAEVRSK